MAAKVKTDKTPRFPDEPPLGEVRHLTLDPKEAKNKTFVVVRTHLADADKWRFDEDHAPQVVHELKTLNEDVVVRVYAFDDHAAAEGFSNAQSVMGTLYRTEGEAREHARTVAEGQ